MTEALCRRRGAAAFGATNCVSARLAYEAYGAIRNLAVILIAILIVCAPSAASADVIVVQNEYYAKAGKEDDVLQTRIEASRIRKDLGLAVGRILVNFGEHPGESATVIWECVYPSMEARESDVRALEESREFKAVQLRMQGLLDRFDRNVWLTSEPQHE